jgi:hypothetical protein
MDKITTFFQPKARCSKQQKETENYCEACGQKKPTVNIQQSTIILQECNITITKINKIKTVVIE